MLIKISIALLFTAGLFIVFGINPFVPLLKLSLLEAENT